MQILYNFIAANLQSLLKCDSMQARDEYFRFHVFINIVKKQSGTIMNEQNL